MYGIDQNEERVQSQCEQVVVESEHGCHGESCKNVKRRHPLAAKEEELDLKVDDACKTKMLELLSFSIFPLHNKLIKSRTQKTGTSNGRSIRPSRK